MAPNDKQDRKEEELTCSVLDQSLSSCRSQTILQEPSFLFKWMRIASSNCYEKDTNPKGIINLGTAENQLCEDILIKKLSSPEVNTPEAYMNYYFTASGDISFREALGTFLEEKFHAAEKLHPENLVVAAGCGAILDMLGFALGEPEVTKVMIMYQTTFNKDLTSITSVREISPNSSSKQLLTWTLNNIIGNTIDYFLSATPHYPRVKNNLGERADVRIYEVPLTSKLDEGDTVSFQLTAGKLESAYIRATKQGLCVRGIILINPNNPLGDVYSESEIRKILYFAHRYELHVIFDEIYALSVFDEKTKFTSILSLDKLPDPHRVHFVWGFSKDFALSGYRCGMLYSRNQSVLSYCKTVAYYQSVPISIQSKLHKIISDREWCDTVYFPTNLWRMRENVKLCKTRLSALEVYIHSSKGGLFLWINVKKYFGKAVTFEEESDLFEEFIHRGVYCVPGRSMCCREPGWFRIIFTVTKHELIQGLNRIEEVLLDREKKLSCNDVKQSGASGMEESNKKNNLQHKNECPDGEKKKYSPVNGHQDDGRPFNRSLSTSSSRGFASVDDIYSLQSTVGCKTGVIFDRTGNSMWEESHSADSGKKKSGILRKALNYVRGKVTRRKYQSVSLVAMKQNEVRMTKSNSNLSLW